MEEAEIIKALLISSPFALIAFILWKSGVLGALASRLKKNGGDERINQLEQWKELAETNHFHDLDELKDEVREISKQINDIDKRLAVVEARQSNGKY